jgi:oleate hydratase
MALSSGSSDRPDSRDLAEHSANTIPVMMPFASAYFQPREAGDRPEVVPKGSVNFAFHRKLRGNGPRDTVFTTEYSIRTGMEAVYTLLNVDRGVPEVWGSVYDVRDLLDATVALRDGKGIGEMKLGFKEKFAMKKVMKTIEGTEVEKLLKKHRVI